MGLTRYQSWFRRFDGDVEDIAGKPDEREFYINTIMHHDFGETFGKGLQRIERTSYGLLGFGYWEMNFVQMDSTGVPQWDAYVDDSNAHDDVISYSDDYTWIYAAGKENQEFASRGKVGGEGEYIDLKSVGYDVQEARGAAGDNEGNMFVAVVWEDENYNTYHKFLKLDSNADVVASANANSAYDCIVFDCSQGEVLCGDVFDNGDNKLAVYDTDLSHKRDVDIRHLESTYYTANVDEMPGVFFDKDNSIIVLGLDIDLDEFVIEKIDVYKTLASDLPDSGDAYIAAAAPGPNGEVYVGIEEDYELEHLYKLDANGNYVWHVRQEDLNVDDGDIIGIYSITVDPLGNIYVIISGGTYGGGGCVFVTPDGEPQWIYRNGDYDWPG